MSNGPGNLGIGSAARETHKEGLVAVSFFKTTRIHGNFFRWYSMYSGISAEYLNMGVNPKIGGILPPKMDGENNGKTH